jgi:cytochrome c556
MRKLVLGITALVAAAGLAQAQQAGPPNPQDSIVARQAGYALQGALVGQMKAVVMSGGNVKSLTDPAKAIAFWGEAIPGLFPTGSETGHDTKAKPEIWSDREGFIKAAAKLNAAATRLAELADANDKAGFIKQFQVMGGACKSCHDAYRKE